MSIFIISKKKQSLKFEIQKRHRSLKTSFSFSTNERACFAGQLFSTFRSHIHNGRVAKVALGSAVHVTWDNGLVDEKLTKPKPIFGATVTSPRTSRFEPRPSQAALRRYETRQPKNPTANVPKIRFANSAKSYTNNSESHETWRLSFHSFVDTLILLLLLQNESKITN